MTETQPRTYVAADEFGVMCLIPIEDFEGSARDAEANYRIVGRSSVSFADVEEIADGDEALIPDLRAAIEDLLMAHGLWWDGVWNSEEVWLHLWGEGIVDGEMPEGWELPEAEANRFEVSVGESYYEGSGLRAMYWAEQLPDSVVEEFGRPGGGLFGEYFGFDWKDEAAVVAALEALGHRVVPATDLKLNWEAKA